MLANYTLVPQAKRNASSGAMQKAHLLITDITCLCGFSQNVGTQQKFQPCFPAPSNFKLKAKWLFMTSIFFFLPSHKYSWSDHNAWRDRLGSLHWNSIQWTDLCGFSKPTRVAETTPVMKHTTVCVGDDRRKRSWNSYCDRNAHGLSLCFQTPLFKIWTSYYQNKKKSLLVLH